MEIELWCEFELWDETTWDKTNDFANIAVSLPDGRRYGINVWTFQFLQSAIEEDVKNNQNLQGSYQIPPDLFVRELTRECVEATIQDLLKRGPLEEVLNPSVFGLAFKNPWMDWIDLPDTGTALEEELHQELSPGHPLHGQQVTALAKRMDNDDVLFSLKDGRLAVVHLTWSGQTETLPFPRTQLYHSQKEFWMHKLKPDIESYSG
jgi:hypothetical protein